MGGLSIWHWLIVLILLAIYAVPTVIAFKRNHAHKWLVLVVSLLTLIGWIIALIWAIVGKPKAANEIDGRVFE